MLLPPKPAEIHSHRDRSCVHRTTNRIQLPVLVSHRGLSRFRIHNSALASGHENIIAALIRDLVLSLAKVYIVVCVSYCIQYTNRYLLDVRSELQYAFGLAVERTVLRVFVPNDRSLRKLHIRGHFVFFNWNGFRARLLTPVRVPNTLGFDN